jgi:DNA-binding NtrC family response regulator
MGSQDHAPPDSSAGRISLTSRRVVSEIVTVPRLELQVEREGGRAAPRRVELTGELLRIGSHPANELVLDDPEVSPFHCCLARADGGFRVQDSGSRTGTRVDGVSVRDADLPLPECTLTLGDSRVRVRDAGAARQIDVGPALALGALWGSSVPMRRLFEMLRRCAQSDSDVLIEGESGTGKELCAAEIVRLGVRPQGPLVIVDCGAVSPRLVESELFGHVRGAFTGAERDREGAFEAADGGTLFLDEIGELPLDVQPKLLRALASREVRRIGDNRVRKIDVRLIAATNRQLEREVNAGRFREDLYYRLSVLVVRVPPLRERPEDIPLLVEHFLAQRRMLTRADLFGPEVIADLMRHPFPGNVRELRNWVERRVVLESDATVPGHPEEPAPVDPAPVAIHRPFKEAKDEVIAAFERAYLHELEQKAGGNVSRAALKAGIDRISMHRLLQRHGVRWTRSSG